MELENQGVEDLWYLNLLGTDPLYQRRGIATMLLETVFKEVLDCMI